MRAVRCRQRRNLLATLLLAQGTPMLLMGDELGRSQEGNNNAYCQDNPITWLRWDGLDAEGEAFPAFVRRLVALRQAHAGLRQEHFLHGRTVDGAGRKDVTWLARDGSEKAPGHWQDPANRCFGLMLGGPGETLLLIANAEADPVAFTLPKPGGPWQLLLDTSAPDAAQAAVEGPRLTLPAYSLCLLAAATGPGLGSAIAARFAEIGLDLEVPAQHGHPMRPASFEE